MRVAAFAVERQIHELSVVSSHACEGVRFVAAAPVIVDALDRRDVVDRAVVSFYLGVLRTGRDMASTATRAEITSRPRSQSVIQVMPPLPPPGCDRPRRYPCRVGQRWPVVSCHPWRGGRVGRLPPSRRDAPLVVPSQMLPSRCLPVGAQHQ